MKRVNHMDDDIHSDHGYLDNLDNCRTTLTSQNFPLIFTYTYRQADVKVEIF